MSRWDVTVVGAGPAGSTAARDLARGGARVCLLDRARFPRPKACGGALSPRVLRHLPPGFEPLLRAQVRRAVFTFRSGRPFELTSTAPMSYMVCRDEFDGWLRDQAEGAGACVRDGRAVSAIERRGSEFLVRANGDTLQSDWVIGADGASSVVAAQLFARRPPARAIAVEAEVAWPAGQAADTVLVDVGRYPGGYGWVFPKGDRVNLGVMLDFAHGRELRGAMDAFVRGLPGLPAEWRACSLTAPVSAPAREPAPCAAAGALLVGDAARLTDPFLGEGIYPAIRSGAFAASALLASRDPAEAAERYERSLAAAIWPEIAAAARLATLFHRMPRWWHRILARMPNALLQYVALLAGEESYTGLLRHVVDRLGVAGGGWLLHRFGMRVSGRPRSALR
jgi:geranylgeranyl reductase family protein